ncbi:MAG: POTRA domain-containing protein [Terriglobales bacterium]
MTRFGVLVLLGAGCALGQIPAGIHIAKDRFRTEVPVKGVDLSRCAAGLTSKVYEGPNWKQAPAEQIRECLQDHGYFQASVRTFPEQLPDKNGTHQFNVTFEIEQGRQYRMGEMRFQGNHVISSEELRPMFHIRAGDVFNLSEVRAGISRMKQAYDRRGYRSFTPIPDLRFDDKTGTIALMIDIHEGTTGPKSTPRPVPRSSS